VDAMIYRKYYGFAPVTVTIDIYEMDDECDVLFHNFLMRRENLHNTFLRFLEQFRHDGEHFIFMSKERTEWTRVDN
jgi:hypothetical protein